ncbi:hypothetical protein [Geomonas subterranea]|uniref:hypothetical protein n=1 Tax=Geomonas subterranea TaxID=2847989 RepID=UPI001CD69065|nr:hypothetical protein [Geomonas fuzhouensis]
MKRIRVLLASKVVGLLPRENDTDLEPTIERVLSEHCDMIAMIDVQASLDTAGCKDIRTTLAKGIRKALPTISPENRFQLSAAAGALRFS